MDNSNIGIIIPTTSKNTSYNNPEDYVFFNRFLPSFLKTASNTYCYKFYFGYDDDDMF